MTRKRYLSCSARRTKKGISAPQKKKRFFMFRRIKQTQGVRRQTTNNRNNALSSNMVLSASPTSVDEAIRHVTAKADSRFGSAPIDLADFVDALPPILRHQKEHAQKSLHARATQDELRGTADDPVSELFGRLDLGSGEWRKYALFDSSKHYTRNLIATDDETFTLLLLCWNPGKESPIHDHP